MRPLSLCALALWGLSGCGSALPQASQRDPALSAPDPAAPIVLSLGLKLSLAPRPGLGSVAVHLALPAGSAAEGPAEAGAAALLAQLILQPLAPQGALAQLSQLGATVESWQGTDLSHYALQLPTEHTAQALQRLSLALREPDLSDAAIERARQDLLRTAEEGPRPDSDAQRRLLALYAPEIHWPSPSAAALHALRPEAVRAFYARQYGLREATLALVGDLDPAQARRWAQEAFPGQPADPTAPGAATALAAPPQAERIEHTDSEQGKLTLAWPIALPDATHAALWDLWAVLLAGPEGHLLQRLRAQEIPVRGLRAWPWQLDRGRALFVIELESDEALRAWPLLQAELHQLAQWAPSPNALARAQEALAQLHTLREEDAREEAARRATLHANLPAAPPGGYLAALRTAELPALVALMQSQPAEALSAVIEAPLPDAQPPPAQAAAQPPPAPAPLPIGVSTLQPGLELWVYPTAGARTVSLHASLEGGWRHEGEHEGDVARLVTHGLRWGQDQALRSALSPDRIDLNLQTTPEELGAAISTLAALLDGPDWPLEQVEWARAQASQPLPLAERAERALWRLWQPSPEAQLSQLSLSPVRAWRDRFVRHAPLRLVLTGQFDPQRLLGALAPILRSQRRAFGALQPATAHPPEAPGEAQTAEGSAPEAAAQVTAQDAPTEGDAEAPTSEARAPRSPHQVEAQIEGVWAQWVFGWSLPVTDPDQWAEAQLLSALLADPEGPLRQRLNEAQLAVGLQPVRLSRSGALLVGLSVRAHATQQEQAFALIEAALEALPERAFSEAQLAAARRHVEAQLSATFSRSYTLAAWLAEHAQALAPLAHAHAADLQEGLRGLLARQPLSALDRLAQQQLLPERRLSVRYRARQALPEERPISMRRGPL